MAAVYRVLRTADMMATELIEPPFGFKSSTESQVEDLEAGDFAMATASVHDPLSAARQSIF